MPGRITFFALLIAAAIAAAAPAPRLTRPTTCECSKCCCCECKEKRRSCGASNCFCLVESNRRVVGTWGMVWITSPCRCDGACEYCHGVSRHCVYATCFEPNGRYTAHSTAGIWRGTWRLQDDLLTVAEAMVWPNKSGEVTYRVQLEPGRVRGKILDTGSRFELTK